MQNAQSPTFPRGRSRFLAAYGEVFPGVLRSPATWFLVIHTVLDVLPSL